MSAPRLLAAPADAPAAPPRRPRLALLLLATGLPVFMASLDNLVMTNALPAIHEELGASVEQLQWFVNAYTLVFASVILLAAGLGDRLGRRRVFLAGIAVFTLASIGAALSTDPAQLIVARAVQGLGGAGIMPLSLTLLTDGVEPRRRPLTIGVWGGIAGLGVAAGPLVGGLVMEACNWQAIFWLNVPVAVLAIPLVLVGVRNAFGGRARIDVLGVLLAGVGVLALVFGIVRGNDAGWGSLEVAGPLALGGVLLVGFVLWERRAAEPLLPLRLFRDRSFALANAAGFGFSFGMFGAVFLLIQYLQIVQGRSPLDAAVLTTPWTMAPMVVAPVAGLLAPRLGTRALLIAGLLLQTLGLVWLAVIVADDTAYGAMLPAFIAAGIGMGLTFTPSSTALLANVAQQDAAKASGTNSTIREVGVALGIAVLTAVFTGAGGQLTPTGYVDAVRPAILVGAAVLLASAIAAAFLPAGRSPRSHRAAPDTLAG